MKEKGQELPSDVADLSQNLFDIEVFITSRQNAFERIRNSFYQFVKNFLVGEKEIVLTFDVDLMQTLVAQGGQRLIDTLWMPEAADFSPGEVLMLMLVVNPEKLHFGMSFLPPADAIAPQKATSKYIRPNA